MPSYVAWTAAILYQLYRHALPGALAALLHLFGSSSSTALSPRINQVLAVLRVPFYRAASTVLVVGIAIQTAVLLEQETADRVGTWLNSRIASPSSATKTATPGLLDLLYIAESPASTDGGGAAGSYASTLSALLTVPLTLPVLPPPSGIDDAPSSSFSEEEIREWEDANAVLRAKLERGMVESAQQWLDVLEHVPPLLLPPGSGSETDTLVRRRIEYLEAVRIELDLVAARNPTLQVYSLAADNDDSEEGWRVLELKEKEREERHQRRMEEEFERWLDGILSVADSDSAEAAGGSGPIDNDDVAMQTKRRRGMLDVPLAGIGQPGPTWRDQLRVQWRTMFDPDAGGVLGNVEREMENLAARFGGGDVDEGAAESSESSSEGVGWTPPDPLPLMAAHHLRAQLASTIADLRSGAGGGGGGGPLAAPPPHQEWERATLPPRLDASPSWPDEFLSLEQLAIRVDRRARKWALWLLGVVTRRASSPPEERTTAGPSPLPIRERVNLLRPAPASTAPFPSFMRTVDATFKVPRDPAHLRIGISQHDLANAIFALAPAEDPSRPAMAPRGAMAREQGEGGCSALQREKWRREAGMEGREEVERRMLRSRLLRGHQEGWEPQHTGGRDEL
ncbi:hypothetical protein JCM8115_007146 [Rhodotorula mucilaginosa]